MERTFHLLLVLWFCFLCRLSACIGCKDEERRALLIFKNCSGVQPENSLHSIWKGSDCCRWKGVGCNSKTGLVESLSIPAAIGESSCDCPLSNNHLDYSFSRLKRLQHLDLSHTSFNHTTIPNSIGSLTHLTHLDLSSTDFSGKIPPSLGNLTNLQHLNFSSSSTLTVDPLAADTLEWLSHLSSLRHLDLSHVQLTDAVDWPLVFNKLPALSELYLAGCGLETFPSAALRPTANVSAIMTLDLSGNSFTDSTKLDWSLLNLGSSLVNLDVSSCSMSGPIPHSLGNLSSLTHLDLSGNNLNGSVPESLRRLTQLEFLDLSGNFLKELTPGILTNLCNLHTLRLSNNKIAGDFSGILPRCSRYRLEELDLSYNQITGSLPDWIDLCNLHTLWLSNNKIAGDLSGILPRCSRYRLEELDLSYNQITGSLPDWIGLMKNLSILDLFYNSLNGSIPESLGQLTKLVDLDLSFNSLQGLVSDAHFANMTNLFALVLSGNDLIVNISSTWVPPFQLSQIYMASCRVGPQFPSWLKTQRDLYLVDMSEAGIADVIPNWFWNATSGAANLDLSNNQIRGELPPSVAFVAKDPASFQDIDLSSNLFHGRLPSISSNVLNINLKDNLFSGDVRSILNDSTSYRRTVILSQNFLSGEIPLSICYMTMEILDLSNNNFTGELPNCPDNFDHLLQYYTVINFASNSLQGSIPLWIIAMRQLQVLRLNNNSFHGEIPTPLGPSFFVLEILDLGENKLTGNIPSWIGEIGLRFLRLRSNRLTGSIPPNLLSNNTDLQVLDLAQNELSGIIPLLATSFSAMAKMNRTTGDVIDFTDPVSDALPIEYSSFEETVSLVVKGRQLEYTKTLSLVMVLDLSCNTLSGEIPIEIMDLVGLQSLNLSGNQLMGKIPDKFGSMAQLEALDLSKNNLSGEIPRSITLLTSISYLNLSYNNLSGRIPWSNQLQTLTDPSSYAGNRELCGLPLRKCPGDEPSKVPIQAEDDTDDSDMFELYLGMGVGYTAGLWGIFVVFLFKTSWRMAFFRFSDDMLRKFSVET